MCATTTEHACPATDFEQHFACDTCSAEHDSYECGIPCGSCGEGKFCEDCADKQNMICTKCLTCMICGDHEENGHADFCDVKVAIKKAQGQS